MSFTSPISALQQRQFSLCIGMGKLRKKSGGTSCLLEPRGRGVTAQTAYLHGTNPGPSLLSYVCSTTLPKTTLRSWSRCPGMHMNEVLDSDLRESRQNFSSQAHWGLECSLLVSETGILYILRLYRVQGGYFPHVQNYAQHMQAPKSSALPDTREAQYSELLASSDCCLWLFVLGFLEHQCH